MPSTHDGPHSNRFSPISFRGGTTWRRFSALPLSAAMKDHVDFAPRGACTCWGIPFHVGGRVAVACDRPISIGFEAVKTPWLVFLHTTDISPLEPNADGFVPATPGYARLAEPVADYVLEYADGAEARHTLRRRHEIGMVQRGWGDGCFQAVAHRKPRPLRPLTDQPDQPIDFAGGVNVPWGQSQTRATIPDILPWTSWLWAWENPRPRTAIVGMRVEPHDTPLVLQALTAGKVSSLPYRWERRRKAVLRLPKGVAFDPALDEAGNLAQLQLDMGQVISAVPRTVYPNDAWPKTDNNALPGVSDREVIVEYTAHPDAAFHLDGGRTVAAAQLESAAKAGPLMPIAPATQRVRLRVVEKASKKPVAVKLHVHGAAGEYLAPIDRHRYPNPSWFEDYSTDFVHQGIHNCTYIDGEATLDLPLGTVYLEVSKGLEIRPVRKAVEITPRKKSITLTLEKVLPWRERGWVTADTHVHFLSPTTALLEGAAEGVNVVNLLASQWGELFTNIGDFDGRTTHGAKEAGGDGEFLVRVGTENRQHILGHISLLGYDGSIIAPVTTGGPDESALGDPVEVLLTEWARQCRKQGGVVVLPHFAQPRAEHAASLVHGDIDAVEMTSWGNLYGGIDPYSLSDWYRYLNCGYFVPAVAGTDKMSAETPVGAIRTYARIPKNRAFTYDAWMDAVRRGDTFVSYGPLLEFDVEGKRPGGRITLSRSGGTLTVNWELASATMPMSRVDLVVNGEVRESCAVKPKAGQGYWTVKVDRSSWLALLVRGGYAGKPEVIAAHSSPVVAAVDGSPCYAAADAVTILDQIEGSLAYLDTVATPTEASAYRRMRLVLTAAHRKLHNQMHRKGQYHKHGPGEDHSEHH